MPRVRCISSNTKACFINTLSNRTRRERASHFNDLCRSSLSPVTWPHRGRLNSFIQRSRLNFNYLKQKSSTRCLQKWQQDVVAPITPAELDFLHHPQPEDLKRGQASSAPTGDPCRSTAGRGSARLRSRRDSSCSRDQNEPSL